MFQCFSVSADLSCADGPPNLVVVRFPGQQGSWNAVTPKGTYIEIEGRVRVTGQWSEWLSWGSWSTSSFVNKQGETVLPGSAPPAKREDALAKVDPDELKVKGSPARAADRFQYRLTLHRAGARNSNLPKEGVSDLSRLDLDLDVPAYSQYQQDPKIAHSICSPTSMAMVMSYHGVHVFPEHAARGVLGHTVPMFGNWPFNTAFVGSRGFASYVDYMALSGRPRLYLAGRR